MSKSEQKIVQYLVEAHASEMGLTRDLQAQIAMTARGGYRSALQSHLRETREHARRVQERARELGGESDLVRAVVGLAESAVGQLLALGKAPLSVLRGGSGEEKVLKNAKDACAGEALEIATYTAIEQLARGVGDETTAKLAASIRAEEERMLERVLHEIPQLTAAVVGAEVRDQPSYELSQTGAADAGRQLSQAGRRAARRAESRVRRTARNARRAPAAAQAEATVAQAERQVKGAPASEQDLAIPDYDRLAASDVVEKLPQLSQIELAKIGSYERQSQNRATVLSRIDSLRGEEPWPGYDEQSVEEIRRSLSDADEKRVKRVRSYERSHKNRTGVVSAA